MSRKIILALVLVAVIALTGASANAEEESDAMDFAESDEFEVEPEFLELEDETEDAEEEETEESEEEESEESESDEGESELEVETATGGPATESEIQAFRTHLNDYLNKYKGCTEPAQCFKDLFPTIEKTRASTPGFTTCVAFQGLAIGYASQKTGLSAKPVPNVNYFTPATRKYQKVPKNAFLQTWGGEIAKKDQTATYVDLKAPGSPRPQAGDLFLLAFNKAAGKMMPGYFSHIGFVTEVKVLADGKEEWTTVAGGGGSAKTKQEAITEGKMIIDTKTGLTGPVANQPGSERRLQGWISIGAILQK